MSYGDEGAVSVAQSPDTALLRRGDALNIHFSKERKTATGIRGIYGRVS